MSKISQPRVRVTPSDPKPGSYEWIIRKCKTDHEDSERIEEARQSRMRSVLALVPGACSFGYMWTVPCPCKATTIVKFLCRTAPAINAVGGNDGCGLTKFVRELLNAAWRGDDLTVKDLVARLRIAVDSDAGEI